MLGRPATTFERYTRRAAAAGAWAPPALLGELVLNVDATVVATTVAAVATGLTAGVYLAFSVLVAPWIAGQDRQPWPMVRAALSLAFTVTAAANVPWNRRIANPDGSSPADLRSWQPISVRWRWGNHLRGGCATLGLIAFLR